LQQSAGREELFQKAVNAIGGAGCSGRCLSLSMDCSGKQGVWGPNQIAQIQKMNWYVSGHEFLEQP